MGKQAIGGGFAGPGGMKLPLPKAVRPGDFVFVSGQMAIDATARWSTAGSRSRPSRSWTTKAILAEAGCTVADVVKCTCWIDDPRDFARFNAVYASYFGEDPPARSTVRAQLVFDGKLEVETIAYKPQ